MLDGWTGFSLSQKTLKKLLLGSFFLTSISHAPVQATASSSAKMTHKTHHAIAQPATHPESIRITSSHLKRFQNSPATVNVMSAKELQVLNVVSPKDVATYTPGITAVNATSGSTPVFSIRGIGLDDYTGNNMGGIGIYQDGVLAPYPVFYTGQMFDTQMVRVEKGPQGFDYGRSSTGGNLAVESTRPGHHFGGYLEWGYSSYGTNTTHAAINTPVNDHIFNRMAFSYINGGAWQSDINTGRHYGGQDQLGLRNLTQFLLDDRSSLLLNVHYSRDRGVSTSPQSIGGSTLNGISTAAYGVGNNPRYHAVNVGHNSTERHEDGGGFSLNYIHGFDFGTFFSNTAFDIFRRNDYDNYDGESLHVGDYHWNDTSMAQSHDMRLETTFTHHTHLTIGMFEAYDKINGAYTGYRSDILQNPNGNLTNHFVQKNISTGLYINSITTLLHGLDFIAAGRFSYDNRGFNGGSIDDGGIYKPAGSYLSHMDHVHHTYNRLTGRTGLRYTIMPGTLVYGTISNGYKAGAYFAAPVLAPQALDYVQPENMIAYEIGAKTTLWHDKITLESSLFDYEYHNRQTLFLADVMTINNEPTNSLSLGPIRRARTRGGELSSTLHNLIPNLDLRSSFAYLDAQTTSTVSSIGGLQLDSVVNKHTSLPFAPRFSWNAMARYGINLPRSYRMTFQTSYTWKGNMIDAMGDPNGKTSKIGSLGMRLEFGPKSGKWTATVYTDNLLNQHGKTFAFTGSDNSLVQYIQTPRWIGGNIRYNF